jgi:NPCBM/NEW2 domain
MMVTNAMLLNTLLLTVAFGMPPVEVRQLDDQIIDGTLVSITAETVVVETSGNRETFPTRQLFSLSFPNADADDQFIPLEDPLTIQFVGGSTVPASGISIEAGRATIQPIGSDSIRAATRSIHSVRFFKPTADLTKQWREIESADDIAGDVLVIRKTQTIEDADGLEKETIALDSLEGVLHDVTDEYVEFEFDGTRVEVPRHKVEGLIYFNRGTSRVAEPSGRVLTLDGAAWNVRSCKLEGDTLRGISVSGVRLNVPLTKITLIDFSIGNLLFLSDLEPDAFEWKAALATRKTPKSASTYYRPRIDKAFESGPLILNSHSYEKGLALHSRSKLTYRLTRDFSRFGAVAGIDDRYRADGNVTLTISGDGEPLLSENLAGSKLIEIDIDLRGVRRLEILVDFGEDKLGYGDYVNLCNARLIK